MSNCYDFWLLLDQAYLAVNRYVLHRLHEMGFTDLRLTHSKAMEQLALEEATATVLAERAQVTKQAIGELVADLERLGYVKRTPEPADRRAKRVRLTERGQAAVGAAFRVLDELRELTENAAGRDGFKAAQRALELTVAEIHKTLK